MMHFSIPNTREFENESNGSSYTVSFYFHIIHRRWCGNRFYSGEINYSLRHENNIVIMNLDEMMCI